MTNLARLLFLLVISISTSGHAQDAARAVDLEVIKTEVVKRKITFDVEACLKAGRAVDGGAGYRCFLPIEPRASGDLSLVKGYYSWSDVRPGDGLGLKSTVQVRFRADDKSVLIEARDMSQLARVHSDSEFTQVIRSRFLPYREFFNPEIFVLVERPQVAK